jgi:hypothetical protein
MVNKIESKEKMREIIIEKLKKKIGLIKFWNIEKERLLVFS